MVIASEHSKPAKVCALHIVIEHNLPIRISAYIGWYCDATPQGVGGTCCLSLSNLEPRSRNALGGSIHGAPMD